MNRGETMSDDSTGNLGSDREAGDVSPRKVPGLDEIEVTPMIEQAIEKHRRDLPDLMVRYAYQWAAYRGGVRLEIGKSKRKLYHKHVHPGLGHDELVVLGIGPEIPDEIGGDELIDV